MVLKKFRTTDVKDEEHIGIITTKKYKTKIEIDVAKKIYIFSCLCKKYTSYCIRLRILQKIHYFSANTIPL